jgi:hypothetical protein
VEDLSRASCRRLQRTLLGSCVEGSYVNTLPQPRRKQNGKLKRQNDHRHFSFLRSSAAMKFHFIRTRRNHEKLASDSAQR